MVIFALLVTVVSFAFWMYALFDVIAADKHTARLLPKPAWVVIVLLLPKIGAVLWFLLGRTNPQLVKSAQPAGPPSAFPEYDHPHRARAASTEDDEEFLRRCRERAEAQRRRAREAQEEREEQDRQEDDGQDRDLRGEDTDGPSDSTR